MFYSLVYGVFFLTLFACLYWFTTNEQLISIWIYDIWHALFSTAPTFWVALSARLAVIVLLTAAMIWLFVKSYKKIMARQLKPFGNVVVQEMKTHNEVHVVNFGADNSNLFLDFSKAIDSLRGSDKPILIGSWIVCGLIGRKMAKMLDAKGYVVEQVQKGPAFVLFSKLVVSGIALINGKRKLIPKIMSRHCSWRITKKPSFSRIARKPSPNSGRDERANQA